MDDLVSAIEADGFAIARKAVAPAAVEFLCATLPSVHRGGVRNLLTLPSVPACAKLPSLTLMVGRVLGVSAAAYRATLFDKSDRANWLVPWHQDLSIPVQARIAHKGWSGWSRKGGVLQVQPPDSVLKQILTARIHLDDAPPENGPLRVVRGSHHNGRISSASVAARRST